MNTEQEFGDRLSRYRPSKLELATGLLLGDDPESIPLPASAKDASLAEALASTILPLLHRPPCCVSFSGGLDSSVILATATDLALRQGLPLPIPVTLRFPGVASAMETTWQELVVSHLRLPDWVKMDFTSELDALGPIARPALRRFGVLTPPKLVSAPADDPSRSWRIVVDRYWRRRDLHYSRRTLVVGQPSAMVPPAAGIGADCSSRPSQRSATGHLGKQERRWVRMAAARNTRAGKTVPPGRASPGPLGLEPWTAPMVPNKAISISSSCVSWPRT